MSATVDDRASFRPRHRGCVCKDPLVTDRVVYRSLMSDNLRWDALKLREGDIIISAPSKCGMTWTQRLVALLVFDGPNLPGPMSTVSPWLDQTIRPIEDVVATLDAQTHRRFIKTHTPLDGLALDPRVTYIGVGRDPRDAAVSMLYQETNIDPERQRALHEAAAPPGGDPASHHRQFAPPPVPEFHGQTDPRHAFHDWMERPIMPPEGMSTLATLLHHFDSFWQRRHLRNVALFHYTDLQTDLVSELIRLGRVLGYDVTRDRAEELAQHASLEAMRARASDLAPNATDGFWRNDEHFFRAGGLGAWREVFTEDEYRRYRHRCTQLVPLDVARWANEGSRGNRPAAG